MNPSSDEWLEDEPMPSKSKKKSKSTSRDPPPPPSSMEAFDDKLDALLDSTAKSTNVSGSVRARPGQMLNTDTSNWSNQPGDNLDYSNIQPTQTSVIRQSNRRAAEEIVVGDIPTISMDDADNDEAIDMTPEVAVAPEFSVHQIASFKEMEQEYARARASQYIDSKIDIGLLYQSLHLQETLDAEEQKPWDWDKLFVEVRNAITNPIIES